MEDVAADQQFYRDTLMDIHARQSNSYLFCRVRVLSVESDPHVCSVNRQYAPTISAKTVLMNTDFQY